MVCNAGGMGSAPHRPYDNRSNMQHLWDAECSLSADDGVDCMDCTRDKKRSSSQRRQ
jgi:hypothetical protein